MAWDSPFRRSAEQLSSNCYCLCKKCIVYVKVVNSGTQNCANNKELLLKLNTNLFFKFKLYLKILNVKP